MLVSNKSQLNKALENYNGAHVGGQWSDAKDYVARAKAKKDSQIEIPEGTKVSVQYYDGTTVHGEVLLCYVHSLMMSTYPTVDGKPNPNVVVSYKSIKKLGDSVTERTNGVVKISNTDTRIRRTR